MDIFTECFFSLSHTLNFSETARQLYISQQAVSKNIAKLEKRVGFPLFYRAPHHVELTPWGKKYLEASMQFVDTCQTILQEYNRDNRFLRISTINQPDFNIIKNTHTFSPADADTPSEIHIIYDTPNTGMTRLLNREADVLVTIDRFLPDIPGLVITPIFDLEAALIVSRSHPKYHENVSFMEFKDEPLIMGVDNDDHFATRESILRDIQSFGLNPSSIMLVPSSPKAMKSVADGKGMVLGSVITISPDNKQLAVVPTGIYNRIVCVWNEKHHNPLSAELAQYYKTLYQQTYDTDLEN